MIAMAKQEGSRVVVYDEKGRRLYSKSGELVGFTTINVSIKESSRVVAYDEKGHRLFTR